MQFWSRKVIYCTSTIHYVPLTGFSIWNPRSTNFLQWQIPQKFLTVFDNFLMWMIQHFPFSWGWISGSLKCENTYALRAKSCTSKFLIKDNCRNKSIKSAHYSRYNLYIGTPVQYVKKKKFKNRKHFYSYCKK